jgi:Spy/CpxP family protein refolding chaperone
MESMKSTLKITVILLVLMTAGSFSLSAQQGMRGMRSDSTRMAMHRRNNMPMHQMMPGQDSVMHRRMDRGMGPGGMRGMAPMCGMQGRFSCPCMDMRMMRSEMMHRGMRGGFGPGERPGMPMIGRIPDLTDKQRNEIADLRQKHQDEMQKFRSGMQEKMKAMRDANRKEIMNLLTPDQKKWLEENSRMIPADQPAPPAKPEAPSKSVM